MARDLLTWETNRSLTYPHGDDGRALRYFEDWQQLILEMPNFDVRNFHHPFDTEPHIPGIPGDDWKPITTEGRTKYFALRKSEVKIAEPSGPYMIMGTAKISQAEIEVGGVKGGFPRNEGDPAFRISFREIPVRIYGADEDRYGELRFHHAYKDEYPASIHLDIHLRHDRFTQLVETILRASRAPIIEITARALLFQDEVERSLNPDWASETFFLPDYPGATIAFASSVTAQYAVIRPDGDGDSDSEVLLEHVEKSPSKTSWTPEAMKLLRQINMALWALVGIVGAFAISRWY